MTASSDPVYLKEADLVARIKASRDSKSVVPTILKTDDRVIARVTDGIYRQPGSALRELISNAYDADATRVVIKTDAPRFSRLTVEDNGHGMSPDALAHLLHHIGGSAKRSSDGAKLGVTQADDPLRSPGGRRLIGKIGIGLFSVSQLTHAFQIITKEKGDAFRTIATVALKQYADESHVAGQDGDKIETGRVNVWREKASDKDSHGTTIALTSIRPQARDTLRSREIWAVIEQNEKAGPDDEKQALDPPLFHIGRLDSAEDLMRLEPGSSKPGEPAFQSLPWKPSDAPDKAFKKLVEAVWKQVDESNPNPQLERIFDYYLRMIWQLSLAVPLPYLDEHLFDLKLHGSADVFLLANTPKGSASTVALKRNSTLRDELELKDPVDQAKKFDVFVDGLQLFRPIRFAGLPTTKHALKKPLIFIGKCREEFSKLPRELSGGPLSFEAYLFWTPKVAPTEHRGSLIRIHGSSGTLFDPTFMRYQVSETTRLGQITCEVFVSEGLDSALNIDRESFNYAHPHSVFITKWLHSALRQLATTQKKFAAEEREKARTEAKGQVVSGIEKVVAEVWTEQSGDPGAAPPAVELSDADARPAKAASEGAYVFSRDAVAPPRAGNQTAQAKSRQEVLDTKLKAIAQILASFGLLDAVPRRKQEKLLRAIYEILEAPEN